MGQAAGRSAADAASRSWTTGRGRIAWTAGEISHTAGLGYWRDCSHSGTKRILDVWPYVGLITIPTVAEAVVGIVLSGCAAAAGSHEYQRRLRRSSRANEANK